MADAKAEFWTTEQVAEYLGITKQEVYESARRNEFPGNVGRQRGRRKLYRSDLIQAGPTEPRTTNDPIEAILWSLNAIEAKLAAIHTELVAQRPQYVELVTTETTYEFSMEEEE